MHKQTGHRYGQHIEGSGPDYSANYQQTKHEREYVLLIHENAGQDNGVSDTQTAHDPIIIADKLCYNQPRTHTRTIVCVPRGA